MTMGHNGWMDQLELRRSRTRSRDQTEGHRGLGGLGVVVRTKQVLVQF